MTGHHDLDRAGGQSVPDDIDHVVDASHHGYDLSSLRSLFQAGDRPLVADRDRLGETGWAIAANPIGVEPLPIKAGSPTVPMPGYDVQILHPDGSGCERGEEGAICIRLPLPPGTLPTLWADDARSAVGAENSTLTR